jgi:glycosyltransferase involved in cell wall biosynthesis
MTEHVPARPGARRRGLPPRVLLTTEGTYPFVVGGVSTWCDLLVKGLPTVRWQLLSITAGVDGDPVFQLPANVTWTGSIELWRAEGPGRLRAGRRRSAPATLPARLARVLSWDAPLDDLVDAFVSCRTDPARVGVEFGSTSGWDGFVAALAAVRSEATAGTAPGPELNLRGAVELYQTLYWLARTAATPTPETDVLHVTAAGWAGIPAVVHKALHGTPLLLTEHGVYVREAYLSAIRTDRSPARRFVDTRLARTLARLAYREADVISPVTSAHRPWEEHLTGSRARIVPIPNGVPTPDVPTEPADSRLVVSVGRLDPLKDVATLLRVAGEVCRRDPSVRFRHYGPVPADQEAYAESCYELHAELGLGDRFEFMGGTKTPRAVMREASVVILTSISEGFPMAVLEALSESRPVVATGVGGVAEALEGCGLVVPPGRSHDLADAVLTLLDDPELARRMGERGWRRVARRYGLDGVLDRYEALFEELMLGPDLTGAGVAA